jgi:histidinol phosphatase-like PHP family hydrolase
LNALEQAIENPNVDVIGHLASEPSFPLEIEEVKQLALLIVQNGKIVEPNAKFQRPPVDWLMEFKEAGVKFHLTIIFFKSLCVVLSYDDSIMIFKQ